ncbi:hypothetical protein ACFXPI_38045, partial [Streptomyces sp. NPDC059104]
MSKPEHTESPAGAPAGPPAAELDGDAATASGDAGAGSVKVPKARSAGGTSAAGKPVAAKPASGKPAADAADGPG